jgi:hypothetical protein
MIRPFSRLCGIFNGFRSPSQAIDIPQIWVVLRPSAGRIQHD